MFTLTSQRLLPSAVEGALNFEVRSPLLGLDCMILFDCSPLSREGAAPSLRGHQLLGRPGKGGLAQ